MSDFVFDYPPSVELLQWLAELSLRQTDVLPMAIRLWVILRSLYGNSDDPVYLEGLNKCFGYSEWRDLFFRDIDSHHQRDRALNYSSKEPSNSPQEARTICKGCGNLSLS